MKTFEKTYILLKMLALTRKRWLKTDAKNPPGKKPPKIKMARVKKH